jgi:hypothetical protein
VPTDGWSLVGGFGLAVISTMVDAITALANGIDQQEQEIAAFVDKVGSQITPIGITAPRRPP